MDNQRKLRHRLAGWNPAKTIWENAQRLGLAYAAAAYFRRKHKLQSPRQDKNFKNLPYSIRQIGKRGVSLNLPPSLVRGLGWKYGTKVTYKKYGRGILVRRFGS